MFYDEEKDQFHLTRVHNGEVVLDICIPYAEVTATECMFDNMVTLRTTSNSIPDGYIASIPLEDWRTIVNCERKASSRHHAALNAQTRRPPLPRPAASDPANYVRGEQHSGMYSSDGESAADAVLNSFTAAPALRPSTKEDVRVPPDVDGSDIASQFGFLSAELQDEPDTTFLTGYENMSVRVATAPASSSHDKPPTSTKPVSAPVPPPDMREDDEAKAREAREMRKLYRKYRPVKTFEEISVDCLHKSVPRGRQDGTGHVSGINTTRSLSPTGGSSSRKPPMMSLADDDMGGMVAGGCIEDQSVSVHPYHQQVDLMHHKPAAHISLAIDLHSQSGINEGSNQLHTVRPKTYTSGQPTTDRPSGIRTRPLTSHTTQTKQPLQAKILDTDIENPLKAGYSLTTTVSPRAHSSSYHSRGAGSVTSNNSVAEAMSDSQVRRPKSVPRSNRSPRVLAGSGKASHGRVRTSGLADDVMTPLCDFIAVPDVVAPPFPHRDTEQQMGPPRLRASSIKVVTLQSSLNVQDKSILSLHSTT